MCIIYIKSHVKPLSKFNSFHKDMFDANVNKHNLYANIHYVSMI